MTWVQQGSYAAGCGVSLLLGLLIGWEGLFHVSIYHSLFLSFKQFARCLCSTPTLGPEYSTHWGSWSLVSRGLVKKALCGRWKARLSREPWRTWFLHSGQSSRARVVDVILCLYWKPNTLTKKFKRWGKHRASLCKDLEPCEPPETVHPLLGHWGMTAQVRTKKSWRCFSLLEDLFKAAWLAWTLFSEQIQDSVVVDV